MAQAFAALQQAEDRGDALRRKHGHQLAGGPPQQGVAPLRRDIRQRHEHEGTLMGPGVWKGGVRPIPDHFVDGDGVEIKWAGGVGRAPHAAGLLLDGLQPGKQPSRIRAVLQPCDAVDIVRLAGWRNVIGETSTPNACGTPVSCASARARPGSRSQITRTLADGSAW